MSEKLLWSVRVQAVDGPLLSASDAMDVEGYDKVAITIADGGSTEVDLGPGGAAVTCLVVIPGSSTPPLTYKIGANDIALDAPLVLLGGAVALAGSPATLKFTNATGADVPIEILVGRDVTP